MRQTAREEEMPISPGPNSSVPEIFSSKKIFFLNSCSGSRRSEIPHIESEYCRRDEVSRRLFHHNNDLCDCDCASDGCGGCIRRNKQCFFKFFVLGLSIALILLLFGSLSYNLTRNKDTEESLDFEQAKWVSHHHEYSNAEVQHSGGNITTLSETEPVLDLPVPIYQHPDDYDSDEDLQRLQYHLDVHPHQIEPISVLPLTYQNADPQSGVVIIYDGREPFRGKRSISSRSKTREIDLKEKYKLKREAELESKEFLFEKLNGVEAGMEKFWESYFKKGKTVFEPFSLTTPSHSTPMESEEYSEEEEIEDDLKSMFLSKGDPANFNPVTSQKVGFNVEVVADMAEATTLRETSEETREENTSVAQITDTIITENNLITENEEENSVGSYTDTFPATESIGEVGTATKEVIESVHEDLRMDSIDGRDFRTWPLFHFPLPFSGLFGSSPQDHIPAESSPVDTVRGISLADAKKIKKEKRKNLLLNSRVVGGSSDVRLPTGPDVSKPFVNAFETLKTNQQLSFTPSAASQFVLPYQMCLFAGPFQGSRPSAHGPQPRTFSFGAPPLLPSIFDKTSQPVKSPQVPTQQNFLSFSINNYPNAPPRQLIQPSGGSFFNFPSQHPFSQYPGPNKQPIFCTYLQPPLFQFPTVPGTADFSHAKCVDCQEESLKDVTVAKDVAFSSGRETLCANDKVSCSDGSSCIPVEYWCDNQVHCRDASDEAFCSCRERVSKDRLCDGYVDCPHGEDETACFDCPKSAFSCGSFVSPGSCIPLSKRCDGVRDCATGADESDCSALFFQVRQNNSYHVSQVTGYLHRNWKGDWFPVCVELGDSIWGKEACSGELGVIPSNVEVRFASVSSHYKGPFIVREGDGTVALQDHCKGHVSTFVTCPPMNCGTRIDFYNLVNPYRDENEKEAVVKRSVSFGKSKEPKQEDENSRLRREETGRVVGGRESEPKAWPWAIAVYKNGAFHCGGVILDEKWVLTAAHCMEQYWKHYYEVRGGMLRRFSYSAMEQPRTVSHVIIHENYDLTIMSNDLALLRVKEPFHFNRWVRPACLPALQDGISKFTSGPAPGSRCTAVGWGALKERGIDPDQLREVEIPIMSRCKHKEDLVGEEICAGKLEGGKDTCQGDSGGPLLCRDSSTPASWYIAGIVSHGEGCARPGEPGAYTRISLFVDWITANTNDFQLPLVKPLQNCPGFRCRSASKLCVPRKWVCNGYTDCLEAEDEKNCSSSTPESILNRKFTTVDKFFGEGAVEGEKFGGILKTLGDQPRVEMGNRQDQQSVEATRDLESVEVAKESNTPQKTLEGFATRTTERGFNPKSRERPTTGGLESAESIKGNTAPQDSLERYIIKTTGRGFRLQSSEGRPVEVSENVELIRGSAAPQKSSESFTGRTTEREFNIKNIEKHTTEGLESAEFMRRTMVAYNPSESLTRRTQEPGFYPDSREVRTTEGSESIELIRGTTAPQNPSEKYPTKTAGWRFRLDSVERRSTEGLENAELISQTTIPQKSTESFTRSTTKREFSPETIETRTTEGSERVKPVSDTTKSQNTLQSVEMRVADRGFRLESTRERSNQDYLEITASEDVTESKSFEKKYTETYQVEKTHKEDDWNYEEEGKLPEYEVTTEEFFVGTEKEESKSYERVTDVSEDEGTGKSGNQNDGNTESEVNTVTEGGGEKATKEKDWKTKNEGTIKGVEVGTEQQESDSEGIENRTTAAVIRESKKEKNTENMSFEHEYTENAEKAVREDGEEISQEKSGSIEEKEITTKKITTEMDEEEVYENEERKDGITTERVVSQTEEQEGKFYGGYTEGDEAGIKKDYQVEEMTTNRESTWQDEEVKSRGYKVTEGIVAESEKNEEKEEGDFEKIVEENKSESKKDSEESEISKEHSTKNSDEDDEEEKLEERRNFEVFTQENLLKSSLTSTYVESTEENKVAGMTEIWEETKAAEETTRVTETHSIRTRETSETEINVEEYSTSSFDATTIDSQLNLHPEYFQCRQIVQSIPTAYRCDGQVDCEDGTDEENCTCIQVLLNQNPEHLCDGRPHCPDLSDEENCSKCRSNEFYCENSHECISRVERCDGMTDCTFGEDEAKCISLGDSPNRIQTEGLMMINKNGVWRAICQEEEGTPFGAGDAINICSALGTVGYERYENRTLGSKCTGFHVTCAKSLMRPVEKYKVTNGSFLWPWNGNVYSDGRLVCSGVLLRPRWMLASSHCLRDISFHKNYLTAKFGASAKSKPIRIDGAHEIPESHAVLLHLSEEVSQTEFIRPLGVPYIFESDPEKDVCVAAGDQTVFLKILKHCQGNKRCYRRIQPTPSACRSKPWIGVIVCQSRFGWYPSSVFSEKLGYCGFEHANFTTLRENLRDVMDKKVSVFPEPFCNGFRCPEGACIPRNKMCDGESDCFDKEDEGFGLCTSKKFTKECKIIDMKCRNGRCIPKVLFGDGIQDCEDGSDEPVNVTCVEYLRLTTPERVCDGKRNCYDKTDEDYSICSCDEMKFQCKLSGYCVPKDFVCDGEKDCPGGEDEEQCMGRKIVNNNTTAHLEVMQKSYGIWHTMCPTHMSKQRSDAFCKDLGFTESVYTYRRNQTVILPQTDPFSWVKLNRKTSIGLRGNKPFVRLVTFKKTCDSVKCT